MVCIPHLYFTQRHSFSLATPSLSIGDKRPNKVRVLLDHDVVLTTCKYTEQPRTFHCINSIIGLKTRLLKLPSVIKNMAEPNRANS